MIAKNLNINCVKCIIVHYERVSIHIYNHIFYTVINMDTSALTDICKV